MCLAHAGDAPDCLMLTGWTAAQHMSGRYVSSEYPWHPYIAYTAVCRDVCCNTKQVPMTQRHADLLQVQVALSCVVDRSRRS